MNTPALEELAARAEALVPVLKQRAIQTEAAGHLPQETIDEFKDAGFFRVFVPTVRPSLPWMAGAAYR